MLERYNEISKENLFEHTFIENTLCLSYTISKSFFEIPHFWFAIHIVWLIPTPLTVLIHSNQIHKTFYYIVIPVPSE